MSLLFRFTNANSGDACLKKLKSAVINFGPQHPASHGVLRLVLQLNGEIVEKIDPHIGFLHRGSEKLMEYRNFVQAAVYLDRLDYTSVLTQTHAYCLAVESLVGSALNTQTLLVRTVFDELARMLNHLLAISTHSLDVGSMATLFWAFEEREKIMELFEYVSGARMHAALYLPQQDMSSLITDGLIIKVLLFLKNCHKGFTEMFVVLFNNRVWKLRLASVGVLSADAAALFGATGPILRGSGVFYDLRASVAETYGLYRVLAFRAYVGTSGDSYDRFLIRARELFESMHLVYAAVATTLTSHANTTVSSKLYCLSHNSSSKAEYRTKMESMISKFKSAVEPVTSKSALMYRAVEAGKGEFGVLLAANNTSKPYRVYLRSPAFNHLQLLSFMGAGHMFADIVTLLGTLDLVFGEVDR